MSICICIIIHIFIFIIINNVHINYIRTYIIKKIIIY